MTRGRAFESNGRSTCLGAVIPNPIFPSHNSIRYNICDRLVKYARGSPANLFSLWRPGLAQLYWFECALHPDRTSVGFHRLYLQEVTEPVGSTVGGACAAHVPALSKRICVPSAKYRALIKRVPIFLQSVVALEIQNWVAH